MVFINVSTAIRMLVHDSRPACGKIEPGGTCDGVTRQGFQIGFQREGATRARRQITDKIINPAFAIQPAAATGFSALDGKWGWRFRVPEIYNRLGKTRAYLSNICDLTLRRKLRDVRGVSAANNEKVDEQSGNPSKNWQARHRKILNKKISERIVTILKPNPRPLLQIY